MSGICLAYMNKFPSSFFFSFACILPISIHHLDVSQDMYPSVHRLLCSKTRESCVVQNYSIIPPSLCVFCYATNILSSKPRRLSGGRLELLSARAGKPSSEQKSSQRARTPVVGKSKWDHITPAAQNMDTHLTLTTFNDGLTTVFFSRGTWCPRVLR
jgi:hypothetical protein